MESINRPPLLPKSSYSTSSHAKALAESFYHGSSLNRESLPTLLAECNFRDLKIPIISPDELSLSEIIGKGSFGVVYKGIYNDKQVAIKQFSTKSCIDGILREVIL